MKKTFWVLAFGVLFGLLSSGMLLLVAQQPQGEAVRLLPPPTPLPLVVHVSGAVAHPGVSQVSPGSRVQDAIQAAGGFIDESDPAGLNLAALLQDGDLVRVPYKSTAGATAVLPANRLGEPAINPEPGRAGGRINLNTATAEALETLPGIGPVTAGKIIAYRAEHGPFATIEAIQDVSGIGPATFAKIQDLITVSDLP